MSIAPYLQSRLISAATEIMKRFTNLFGNQPPGARRGHNICRTLIS